MQIFSDIDRVYLAKFRCRSNNLPVAIKHDQNLSSSCTKCGMQTVCDEFHYVLVCPYFSVSRRMYVKKYYCNRPNTHKMNELFTCTKIRTLRKLATFVRIIMSDFIREGV